MPRFPMQPIGTQKALKAARRYIQTFAADFSERKDIRQWMTMGNKRKQIPARDTIRDANTAHRRPRPVWAGFGMTGLGVLGVNL